MALTLEKISKILDEHWCGGLKAIQDANDRAVWASGEWNPHWLKYIQTKKNGLQGKKEG